MQHYFKVYGTLLKINFSLITAYRAGFINSLITTVLWGGFQMVWVLLLTSRIKSFYGWSREELIFLTANYVFVSMSLFHTIFSRNFDRFSRIIDRGELDSLLIKPIDSQFLVSFWYFNYAYLLRLFIGAPIIIYLIFKIGIPITLISLISYIVLIFVSIAVLYSIWLAFSSLLIWFPRLTNLTSFLYNLNGVSRFPPEMISELKSFILFFLIPLTLLNAIPTKALFSKAFLGEISLLIFLALILFYLARKFWHFALRHYTSASS